MRTSKTGLNLILEFEGCKLKAYKCPAGVWTIGVGHTGTVGGEPICKGMTIDINMAYLLLQDDVKKFEREVNYYNEHYRWTQNEYDALVSFAFNIGNINQLTAGGTRTKDVIARKMLQYNKSNNVPLAGLTRRRRKEQKLFTTKEVK